MRCTVAQGIAVETVADKMGSERYAHNAKSKAYISGTSQFFFKCMLDYQMVFQQLPQYFRTHSKEDLYDIKKSPYAFAHGMEGSTYYEVISADPERLEMFNMTLSSQANNMPVLGMFPFSSLKSQVEAEPDRPFIVDVGGGRGAPLMTILSEAPNGFGANVLLQDRPDVLASVPQEDIPGVEKMVHDFFTPQPVKNAHIYHLRLILHDFYEPVCVEILKNIASAMGPTSRVLIRDFVVPERTVVGADYMVYWMDFAMMTLTGKEKTKKQFEEILDEAGLQLVRIWPYAVGAHASVEAKLKDA